MNRTGRRNFLKTAAAGAAAVACGRSGRAASKSKRPPNVILIMVDDMGFSDLGCYGSAIETPNIDKLAAGGLKFTQFYNTAKCEPTRASLLTGCYHREVGGGALRNAMTLGQAMQRAGYRTLMTGKWHMSSTPIKKGFDRYFGHLSGATNFFTGDNTFRLDEKKFTVPKKGFYTTDANTGYAMQFLDETARKHSNKPFFLYVAYNAPHYPLQAWPEDIAKYKGKFMKGWDALRVERHQRQLKMGLLDPKWKLTPRDPKVPAWDTLSDDRK
ncbi:MAG: sulfatase-like hydrolase/transferase, partial [Planctomycetes bacterium]|nr:sulfatase-like hydrolase/transferase [Planctomycetota bacterium]